MSENEVFGHARAVAADQAVQLEHDQAAAGTPIFGQPHEEARAMAREAHEQYAREQESANPYVGQFDRVTVQDEELKERAALAMGKAMRVEAEGRGDFSVILPGPASLFHASNAMFAACMLPEFRQDPVAVVLAEKMGREFARALESFPGHEASFRPLGQSLAGMWEAYGRLGASELRRRYDMERRTVPASWVPEVAAAMPGTAFEAMPGTAFEAMARATELMGEALRMLAEYPWHPEAGRADSDEKPSGDDAVQRFMDAVDDVTSSPRGTFSDHLAGLEREGVNPWFERVKEEPTPVADSVLVDMATTQTIPAEARAAAVEALTNAAGSGLVVDAAGSLGHKLSEFAGHEAWQCARCDLILHGIKPGQEAKRLAEHQKSPECAR